MVTYHPYLRFRHFLYTMCRKKMDIIYEHIDGCILPRVFNGDCDTETLRLFLVSFMYDTITMVLVAAFRPLTDFSGCLDLVHRWNTERMHVTTPTCQNNGFDGAVIQYYVSKCMWYLLYSFHPLTGGVMRRNVAYAIPGVNFKYDDETISKRLDYPLGAVIRNMAVMNYANILHIIIETVDLLFCQKDTQNKK